MLPVSDRALTKRMGIPRVLSSSLRRLATWKPFIWGIITSSMIRSGGSWQAAFSAMGPLGKALTLTPPDSSNPLSTCRFSGVSSTTITVGGRSIHIIPPLPPF